MLLIEYLVHGKGPDLHENGVRVELHGNEEVRDHGARKSPLRPNGPWGWCLLASPTGVVEIRGLTSHPPSLQ